MHLHDSLEKELVVNLTVSSFIISRLVRCVRLALVHDMAECIVGDIAPADNVPKEEKHRREEVSVNS